MIGSPQTTLSTIRFRVVALEIELVEIVFRFDLVVLFVLDLFPFAIHHCR